MVKLLRHGEREAPACEGVGRSLNGVHEHPVPGQGWKRGGGGISVCDLTNYGLNSRNNFSNLARN